MEIAVASAALPLMAMCGLSHAAAGLDLDPDIGVHTVLQGYMGSGFIKTAFTRCILKKIDQSALSRAIVWSSTTCSLWFM